MPSVFVSYTRADFEFAQRLWQQLKSFRDSGGSVFFDKTRLQPGDPWNATIAQAMEEADLFVLLLSPDFLDSNYCVERETRRALERRHAPGAVPRPAIHTVLINACMRKGVPANVPGGEDLASLHAAGPFDAKNRLVPMTTLAAGERDLAWQGIVAGIHRHFGMPVPMADEAPLGTTADDGSEVPDASALAAECNRGSLVEALAGLATAHPGAVLLAHGHRLDEPLLRRLARDLAQPPWNLPTHPVFLKKQRVGTCRSATSFENAMLANVHDPASDDRSRFASTRDLLQWARRSHFKSLLVGHSIDGGRAGLQEAREALAGAFDWLAGLEALPVLMVLSVEGPAEPLPAGLFGRLRSRWSGHPLLLEPTLQTLAAGRRLGAAAHLLKDYEPGDVQEWMGLPTVKAALRRRTQVAQNLAFALNDPGTRWTPARLYTTASQLTAS